MAMHTANEYAVTLETLTGGLPCAADIQEFEGREFLRGFLNDVQILHAPTVREREDLKGYLPPNLHVREPLLQQRLMIASLLQKHPERLATVAQQFPPFADQLPDFYQHIQLPGEKVSVMELQSVVSAAVAHAVFSLLPVTLESMSRHRVFQKPTRT